MAERTRTSTQPQKASSSEKKHPVVVLHEATQQRAHALSAHTRNSLAQCVASCLLVVCLAWGFSSCAAPADGALFLMAALVMTGGLLALSVLGRGERFVAGGAVVVALASVAALVAAPSFRAGLFGFANQLIARFDDVFNAYVPLLPATGEASGWLFFVLAGLGAALGANVLVRRRMALTLTALLFPLGAAALWLQAGQAILAFAAGFAAWLLVWRAALGGTAATLRGLTLTLASACLMLVVGAGVAALYEPNATVDQAREGLVEAVDTLRFGTDSLPEGNLAAAAQMNAGEEERLVVSFTRVLDDDLHLRGYVGATWEANTWKPLDHTAYEGTWTGMYPWLGAEGFAPSRQRAILADEDAAHGGDQPSTTQLTVQTIGADRAYVYAPTTLRTLEGASVEANRDGSLLAKGVAGASSYTLEVDAADESADVASAPAWLVGAAADDGYPASEAVYRSFVRDHYLALDDADRALVDELFYGDATWSEEDPTVSAVISRVRVMLTTLASYTDTPPSFAAAATTTRFLTWFLTQEREGNAAAFATAAVMAFRAQDVPARYVEGYRATAAELARAATQQEGTLTLTSRNAHAWVEIYLDGIGWAPVEVTPGFYDQPYQVEDVIEVNQVMAGGGTNESPQAASLGGDTGDEEFSHESPASPAYVLVVITAVLAVFVGFAVVLILALEVYRALMRRRRRRRCASDDQAISVPALADELAALVACAGVPLEPTRPLEATAAVAAAFPSVAPEEYERVVALAQKAVFGCKELRVNEMRTLRRFNVRLAQELKHPSGVRAAFARRYRYGV